MLTHLSVRGSARALVRSAAVASAITVGLGAAYIAVGAVENRAAQARSQRLADAVAHGFSEAALRSQGRDMAPGALAIARRHDPYGMAGDAARDRDASLFAARLEQAASGKARPASRTAPAAQPFRLANALDSSRELECLTQAVYFEARGETAAGQAAVAQVVLNRVRHPAFPKTVCGVIFQGASSRTAQFSFTNDGSLRRGRESGAWRRAQKVAARALDGYVIPELGKATHFHATRVSPGWGGMVRVASVGQHVFYRFGARGGGVREVLRPKARPDTEARTVYASILPTQIAAPAAYTDAVAAPAEASPAPRVAEVAAEAANTQETKGLPAAAKPAAKAHDTDAGDVPAV